MIGATFFIQHQIPVDESVHSVIEPANNVVGIERRMFGHPPPGMAAVLHAGFGTDEKLIGGTAYG